jgi:vacuolar-type H+-ATPase subunit E/Vma4
MINAEELKKLQDQAKENLAKMMKASDDILKMLSKENPEVFEKVSKDLHTIKNTKDLSELQKIMSNYAIKYNK